MAEPEEESDEEWYMIADVVGVVEQQFIQARAQTATGQAGVRAHPVAQQHIASSPPQQQLHASPPVQPQAEPRVQARLPPQQQPQMQPPQMRPPHQFQQLQRVLRPQQPQQPLRSRQSRSHVPISTTPPTHTHARAQTAADQAGVRAHPVAQQHNASSPPPQQLRASPPVQPQAEPRVQAQVPAQRQPQMQPPPMRPPHQFQQLQRILRPQQPQQPLQSRQSRSHVPISTPPPTHPTRRHVQFPQHQVQPVHQTPPATAQVSNVAQVTSTHPSQPRMPPTTEAATTSTPEACPESPGALASLRAENARLHQEYRTRIRHLEAQLQNTRTQGNLRSQLALAERELRTLRSQRPRVRMGGTQATQAGEVVEATQTGLEVLKASVAADVADVDKRVEMFGCGGLDIRVEGGLLRRELFGIYGYERLPGVSVCTGCEDWCELTRVLVGLVGGEGWMCALRGLEVLLRVRETRGRIIGMKEIGEVIECIYGNEFGFGVLEEIVMGCAEIGESGDGVRRLVIGDERLPKMFRNGRDVDGVVKMSVIAVLECDDGRVDDREWGVVEGLIGECCKNVGEGVRMDVLGIASVLAAEVVIRYGGVEGLLEFVCERGITGNDDGLEKGLGILATVIEEGMAGVGEVRVRGAVKIVGMGGLVALAKRNDVVGELACRIIHGLYTLEKTL